MLARLKHVDPERRPSAFSRANAAFANTSVGRFLSIHFVWKVDPWLMRLTRGRVGMGIGIPTALLETRGAKSGARRRNAVIYFHDGDRVTIVASKLGLPQHPAWFHNLRADPEVTLGGIPMRAEVVADEAELEGSGQWQTVSSRPTRRTGEKRPRPAGRSRSFSWHRVRLDRIAQTPVKEDVMYARVASWEGVDAETFAQTAAEIRERAEAESGPPEGVPAKEFLLLSDADNGRTLAVTLFETEDDYRQGDETLNSMSPPSGGMGQRVSVDQYKVEVRVEA